MRSAPLADSVTRVHALCLARSIFLLSSRGSEVGTEAADDDGDDDADDDATTTVCSTRAGGSCVYELESERDTERERVIEERQEGEGEVSKTKSLVGVCRVAEERT